MLDHLEPGLKIKKKSYRAEIEQLQQRLGILQARSHQDGLPVILVFEGPQKAGMGGCIRSLAEALDPQWLQETAIDFTSPAELRYPWMRSYWLDLPPRGSWAIYPQSWYQRVLDDRLEGKLAERAWRQAYRDILEFERTLSDDGYLLVKYFLHLSETELIRQRQKKGGRSGKAKRGTIRHYSEWLQACEEMLAHTDTKWAPWNLISARRTRYLRLQVAQILVETLERKLGVTPAAMAVTVPATPADKQDSSDQEIKPPDSQNRAAPSLLPPVSTIPESHGDAGN